MSVISTQIKYISPRRATPRKLNNKWPNTKKYKAAHITRRLILDGKKYSIQFFFEFLHTNYDSLKGLMDVPHFKGVSCICRIFTGESIRPLHTSDKLFEWLHDNDRNLFEKENWDKAANFYYMLELNGMKRLLYENIPIMSFVERSLHCSGDPNWTSFNEKLQKRLEYV